MLGEGEWLIRAPAALLPEKALALPRASLDDLEKTQITNPCHNRTFGRPACSLVTMPPT